MNEIYLKQDEILVPEKKNGKVEFLVMDPNGDLTIDTTSNGEIYWMELYMPNGTPKKLEKYVFKVVDKVKAETLAWVKIPEKIKYNKYTKARFSDLPSVYCACYIIVSGNVVVESS